jgi:hypothetical protein
MPKPLKKRVRKLKTPVKPKRPTDPNRAAHAMLAEHMAKAGESEPDQPSFKEQLSAHMAKLGRKGGKASGAKRMENLSDEQRQQIAFNAARARWAKTKQGKP